MLILELREGISLDLFLNTPQVKLKQANWSREPILRKETAQERNKRARVSIEYHWRLIDPPRLANLLTAGNSFLNFLMK